MQTHRKRGRDGGRRRCVIAASMPEYDLDALDAMAARLSAWRGRKIGRSEMLRKLISVGVEIMAGREVRNIR